MAFFLLGSVLFLDEEKKMVTFSATVRSRSSRIKGGPPRPPSETKILRLNPQRREKILEATGWEQLFPGTLNSEVAKQSVRALLRCTPLFTEKGETVKYPEKFAYIPKLRGGYLYYSGRILKGDKRVSVLIRGACNPLTWLLEAFSPEKLRDVLMLSDDETVTCEVDE